MASFNIHLAIGKRYAEKSKTIKNYKDFYRGIIEPDLVNEKSITHYTGIRDEANLARNLANKVRLNEYLKHNNIDSDYEKGVFLHLITDYLFFNNFFESDYINNNSYENFCKDLYYSYDITNEYLVNKYKIDYADFLEQINNNIKKDNQEKNVTNEIRTNILPSNQLDRFIEYVSDISLDEYKNKIVDFNDNILP